MESSRGLRRLVIVGAGGFGREVLWLVHDINRAEPKWDVLGFLDDNPRALDGLESPARIVASVDGFDDWDDTWAVCAAGDPKTRADVVARLEEKGARWARLFHPTSFVGTGSTVGEGCIFCRDSGITANSSVGNHVHFNIKSTAGHDTRLGDFCTLSAHVDINGGAVLEEGVFVGSHGVVLPEAHLGAWARVGAGSVVLRNVPPDTTVFGVPSKPIGKKAP